MNLTQRISAACGVSRSRSTCMLGLLLLAFSAGAHAETGAAQGRLITSAAIAVNPVSHKVYGVNEPGNSISVFDERTGTTHAVKVGNGPVSLAIDSRLNRIYVVNDNSDSISVIDGTHDTVIATIQERTGSHPYMVAVDYATSKAYVTNTYSNALTVINGPANTSYTLKTGSANGIATEHRTQTISLTTYESPNIRLVNPVQEP